jgi:succinate-semialdehyde dehydrogenase/glutarate-semialdehyde dehydrogenase
MPRVRLPGDRGRKTCKRKNTMTDLPAHDLIKPFLTDSGLDVTNPATGEKIATIKDWSKSEMEGAVEDAEKAWADWRAKTAKERGAVMRKWYSLLMDRQEDLAQLMTLEQGKVLSESRTEIA